MSLGLAQWLWGLPAVTIENTDPGGIAIDDILYEVEDAVGITTEIRPLAKRAVAPYILPHVC